MDNEQTEVKGLSNSRFASIIFLIRLAGIPFNMKNMSTLYAIYIIITIPSTCITFVGMCVDVYVNRDDVGHAMTNIRALISLMNVLWILSYCR